MPLLPPTRNWHAHRSRGEGIVGLKFWYLTMSAQSAWMPDQSLILMWFLVFWIMKSSSMKTLSFLDTTSRCWSSESLSDSIAHTRPALALLPAVGAFSSSESESELSELLLLELSLSAPQKRDLPEAMFKACELLGRAGGSIP